MAHGDAVVIPKQTNDEFSGIGTSKFEFRTIINHYKDIHNGILHKNQKNHKKGVFLALKVPEGREPEFSGIGSGNCRFITNDSYDPKFDTMLFSVGITNLRKFQAVPIIRALKIIDGLLPLLWLKLLKNTLCEVRLTLKRPRGVVTTPIVILTVFSHTSASAICLKFTVAEFLLFC